MRPVEAVVFDLDGTLVDSRADIVAAVRFTLAAHAGPPVTDDAIASYVGDGARLLLARTFRMDPGDPGLDSILPTFLDHYAGHAADQTRLMPGALEALDTLSPLPLAICTNKPRAATEAVLRALGVAARFRAVVAGGDLPVHKPDPAPLVHIAATLGVAAEALVMVGDGVQDIECGRRAGARTVAVTFGFAPEERLRAAGPDAVITTFAELGGIVAGFGG